VYRRRNRRILFEAPQDLARRIREGLAARYQTRAPGTAVWIANPYGNIVAVERSAQVFAEARLRLAEEARSSVHIEDVGISTLIHHDVQSGEIHAHA